MSTDRPGARTGRSRTPHATDYVAAARAQQALWRRAGAELRDLAQALRAEAEFETVSAGKRKR